MSGDSFSTAFSSFWKRSADKSPSKKLVFLPPNETNVKSGRADLNNEETGLTTKQLRRAQVRRAQTEHRNRKKNYVKHLEQDVINLRKSIAATLEESSLTQTENDRMRKTLRRKNFPTFDVPIRQERLLEQPPTAYGDDTWPLPNFPLAHSYPLQDMDLLSGASVAIGFDSVMDASCLHVQHQSPTSGPEIVVSTPTMFSFSGITSMNSDLLTATLNPPDKHILSLNMKAAEIGINFILALEHPCREHFQPIPADFHPRGSPTGHELMASTSFYAQAPPYVFVTHSDVAWDISSSPVSELERLREMNESLPKRDSDITPVQAWFLLVEKYGLSSLVGYQDAPGGGREGGFLERLRRELAGFVDCFGFGAAMDKAIFWEIVEQFRPI